MHEFNCFITLTYSDVNLPENGSLCVRDFQLFMKRLRKHIAPHKVRFFAGGEYGDLHKRPHYHALLFGYDFPDKKLHSPNGGQSLYTSATLEKIWKLGFATIGAVSFESAQYVASYCHKKLTGKMAALYDYVDPATGEVISVTPEFGLQSRNPGIGAIWFKQYGSDVYPRDQVIARGHEARPPKYYDKLLEKSKGGPHQLHDLRVKRRRKLLDSNWAELEPARLRDKEICALAKLKLKRTPLS